MLGANPRTEKRPEHDFKLLSPGQDLKLPREEVETSSRFFSVRGWLPTLWLYEWVQSLVRHHTVDPGTRWGLRGFFILWRIINHDILY